MLGITRRLLSAHCKSPYQFHGVRGIQQKLDKITDLLSEPLVDTTDGNIFDIVSPWRTEEIYNVEGAESINNLFSDICLPQHPWMAKNNWNSPHQDSYCSESVGLYGPNGSKLKLVKQYNPYGFVPTMVCNQHNQLIGIAFKDGIFRLVTFDKDCNILTSNAVNTIQGNSFGGGYFYLNNNNDTIVVEDHYHLACYKTSDDIKKIIDENINEIGKLPLKWKSENLKDKMLIHGINVTGIYSTLPIWNDPEGNKYWVLMPGEFNYPDNNTTTNPVVVNAFVCVMEIDPDTNKTYINKDNIYRLDGQYVNNTIAADETGVYFVTNKVTMDKKAGTYQCNNGYLVKLTWDPNTNKVGKGFVTPYENAGYLKRGMANVGSGTTPTIFKISDDPLERNYVTINDNANPQMNICIYDSDNGECLSKIPVFDNMKSADEASFIGVNGHIIAENNFGHDLKNLYRSQYVANAPGMTMINFDGNNTYNTDNTDDNIIWTKDDTKFFAMSMLCRESGIIYAFTCDWNDDESAIKGGMFYISAIDSFDGRTVWRVPIGRGHPYQHSVGGIYFDRTGQNLFVGTYDFLVSIQNFDNEKKFL